VASLGTEITPVKLLIYISVLVLWCSGGIFLYFQLNQRWLGFVELEVGCLFLFYYGIKYFFAYRLWLDSYVNLGKATFIRIFSLEQKVKIALLGLYIVRRWLWYSQSRQERWNRSHDDVRGLNLKPKWLEEFRQENRPNLFTFGANVGASDPEGIDISLASRFLGYEKAQFLQSLNLAMSKTRN
jgi:hypothetical protein